MIGITTPQAAGISELEIQGFMRQISRRGITMHSVVMLRGNDIFFELTTIQQNRTSSARWWSGCVPEEDFIFVCTGDNQYNDMASEIIFRAVFDHLIPDEPAQGEKTFELSTAFGEIQSDFAGKISGETFDCGENPMGIEWFRLEFGGDGGCLVYKNAQGEKRRPFGMGKNVFGKFPQLGYSDERGNVHELNGFMYACAASAGWIEPRKLQLRVQIIDRYFGSTVMTFGFRDERTAAVRMIKHAEDFLSEYDGWMAAHKNG